MGKISVFDIDREHKLLEALYEHWVAAKTATPYLVALKPIARSLWAPEDFDTNCTVLDDLLSGADEDAKWITAVASEGPR